VAVAWTVVVVVAVAWTILVAVVVVAAAVAWTVLLVVVVVAGAVAVEECSHYCSTTTENLNMVWLRGLHEI
jgi:hypothetical protein